MSASPPERAFARDAAVAFAIVALLNGASLTVLLSNMGPGGSKAGAQVTLWMLASATAAAGAAATIAWRARRGDGDLSGCLLPFTVSVLAAVVGNAFDYWVDTRGKYLLVASIGLAGCIALGALRWPRGTPANDRPPGAAIALVAAGVAAACLVVRIGHIVVHHVSGVPRIWISTVAVAMDELAFLGLAALLLPRVRRLSIRRLISARPAVSVLTAGMWAIGVFMATRLASDIYAVAGAHVRGTFGNLDNQPAAAVAALAFVAIALGPIAEEILFRGVVYRTLRDRLGLPLGTVLAAAVFAAMHLASGAPSVNFLD